MKYEFSKENYEIAIDMFRGCTVNKCVRLRANFYHRYSHAHTLADREKYQDLMFYLHLYRLSGRYHEGQI